MPAPPTTQVRCFVALGSNLGDREAHLCRAREGLEATSALVLRGVSSLYETTPVGPGEQGPYLNAVVAVSCDLTPRALLERLLAIERAEGRLREHESARWGPRTLDLDLLLFGDSRIDEPGLVVPHPRMHERAFVLEPLCEIDAALMHPFSGERFAVHREAHRDAAAVARYASRLGWRAQSVAKPVQKLDPRGQKIATPAGLK